MHELMHGCSPLAWLVIRLIRAAGGWLSGGRWEEPWEVGQPEQGLWEVLIGAIGASCGEGQWEIGQLAQWGPSGLVTQGEKQGGWAMRGWLAGGGAVGIWPASLIGAIMASWPGEELWEVG